MSSRLPIDIPAYSEQLAEFCGIMLGDGGISAAQVTITLHKETDYEYSLFVILLIHKLFGIIPSVYYRENRSVLVIVISRVALVEFLNKTCDLVIGNKIKQGADIPNWIKEKPSYLSACVRGLFDTDGSVFNHRYFSKEKLYSYKKLSFTSVAEPLLHSAHDFLLQNNFHARIGSIFDVRLDSKIDVARYFELIGSHNPKHLNRYAT